MPFGIQPHRSKSFQLSTDPLFIDKVRDIVGLYLNPPDHAAVLCVDEKSQVQALERTQPVLPLGLGYIEGVTHNYIRHGTTTLFAALDIANGRVLTQCRARHRHQEFLGFLSISTPMCRRHSMRISSSTTIIRRAQAPQSARLARRPAALPPALHADLRILAQSGRALVRG